MTNSTASAIHLQSLIAQYHIANEQEKPAIKRELLLNYYQITAQERVVMREAMNPFLAELRQEMLAIDPLIQQADELTARLNKSGQVLSWNNGMTTVPLTHPTVRIWPLSAPA